MTHNLHDPPPPLLSLRNKRWWVSRLLLIFTLAMPVEAGRCFCAVNSYGRFLLFFFFLSLLFKVFFFNTTASFVNNSLSGSLEFRNLCNRLVLRLANFLHGFLHFFSLFLKHFLNCSRVFNFFILCKINVCKLRLSYEREVCAHARNFQGTLQFSTSFSIFTSCVATVMCHLK